MSTQVRYYRSSMSVAPLLGDTPGMLVALLDACLVNGFGEVTLDSLVVSSDVATATLSGTGHGFTRDGSGSGTLGCQVIRISGATPSELNGDWRINRVSSTVFTFVTSGIPDQTATGTITAKVAPAGFEKVFSGTNKAVYRSLNTETGTRFYCRIEDSNTGYAFIRGYESMSSVDVGIDPFPTVAQRGDDGYWIYKANNSSSRIWTLISDGRIIYFFCDSISSGTNQRGGFVFGDIIPYLSYDVYASLVVGGTSTTSETFMYSANSGSGTAIARGSSGFGKSQTGIRFFSHRLCQSYLGADGETYPASASGGVQLWPIEVFISTTVARGLMPGCWCPVHTLASMANGMFFTDVDQMPDRAFMSVKGLNGTLVFDITGPWR